MRREEALQRFHEEDVEPQIEQSLAALDLFYQENEENLAEDLKTAFRKLWQRIAMLQAAGQKNSIVYIYGSFLYSSLCLGQSAYRLDAYDETWFLDTKECAASYDAAWAFSFLHDACDRLYEKSKKYAGCITRYDIACIKRAEAPRFSEYIEELGKVVIEEMFLTPEFQELKKADELTVYMGEYKDQCQEIGTSGS
ncbi:hypothetical protein [Anaerosinus massiliensis]|uniref:hypothetical protein n=1 Tax=Massilibacillus massiliensis TaxID=1806837 RepID=UPI000DA621AA|nr:hypothetical protein [Massilibacillus massiliensis]